MRTTIVPAQITTVEDKIAGNLGVTQLLLLVAPIFAGAASFVILPPFFGYATYKIVLIVCLAVLFGVLSIRVKGKILLLWAMAILRYNIRPRFYVFDKNDAHLRDVEQHAVPDEVTEESTPKQRAFTPLPRLSTADMVRIESILTHPEANPSFEVNSKGELSVRITEVQ